MEKIRNNYGNYFKNGNMTLKLCYYMSSTQDDYIIWKRAENDYIIGHNNNIDFDNFTCSWAWGHYNYSYDDAKKWIIKRMKEDIKYLS